MARERRHKRKIRRRRGRFAGLYKMLSVLLVTAAVVSACIIFFPIHTVSVVGNVRYSAEEIVSTSGLEAGDNLVLLPKRRIADRLLTRLPYLSTVDLERQFPDRVVLVVEEHRAAAAVSDGTEWWFISAEGKLLEQSDVTGPMRISGITAVVPRAGSALAVAEGEQARLDYALRLLAELERYGMAEDCAALDCSVTGQLQLSYLDFLVKLPTTADYGYVLHSLESALDQDDRVSREDSGVFDFTVEDGKFYFSRSG